MLVSEIIFLDRRDEYSFWVLGMVLGTLYGDWTKASQLIDKLSTGPAKPDSDDVGPSGVPEGPPQDQEDPHGDGKSRGSR